MDWDWGRCWHLRGMFGAASLDRRYTRGHCNSRALFGCKRKTGSAGKGGFWIIERYNYTAARAGLSSLGHEKHIYVLHKGIDLVS